MTRKKKREYLLINEIPMDGNVVGNEVGDLDTNSVSFG